METIVSNKMKGGLSEYQLFYEELHQSEKGEPSMDIGLYRIYRVRDFIHGIISYTVRQIALVTGYRRIGK